MAIKILTVDDSRAVRIIVKKAFSSYDVQIFESANGVEGLAVASQEKPDLILLDVTMPVMDGIEMLTKLKADSDLKNIPVIMLTAEAGRENVLKIAKIGIRDYIVKPFKEDVLIEKSGRIIELRPFTEGPKKQKGIHDECFILVVEDKPTIVDQIKEGLSHTPWKIISAASPGEAVDECSKQSIDLIIISLSLAENGGIGTFRMLRSNMKTKYTPVFGLAVKTATDELHQAQEAGFNTVITKPIDFNELETKISKAINLDTSEKYFALEEDFLIIHIPGNVTAGVLNEVSSYLKPRISKSVDNGYYKVIIDVHEVQTVNMDLIKLLHETMRLCKEMTLKYSLVGNDQLIQESKGFEESKDWTFFKDVEEAKSKIVN